MLIDRVRTSARPFLGCFFLCSFFFSSVFCWIFIALIVIVIGGVLRGNLKEAKKKKVGGGTTLYYFKEMGEHATPDYLAKTQKPMLIMQGEKDFQAKADKDFGAYKELLKDRDNVTFKLYKNLNHAFVPSVYGDIAKAKQEYNVEQHISEEVITDIADWIKQFQHIRK